MLIVRECIKICTEKSSPFKKFWYAPIAAFCSSSERNSKFMPDTSVTARGPPSRNTMQLRSMRSASRRFWVARDSSAIRLIYPVATSPIGFLNEGFIVIYSYYHHAMILFDLHIFLGIVGLVAQGSICSLFV